MYVYIRSTCHCLVLFSSFTFKYSIAKCYKMFLSTVYVFTFVFFTIGVLAGMRPCGIIVLLSELFFTESKSQVYASLHEYFQRNPVASNNLGNQINTCIYIYIYIGHF